MSERKLSLKRDSKGQFSIENISKEQKAISPALYDEAEKLVKNIITSGYADYSAEELQQHNYMLQRCAAGDVQAQKSVKELIAKVIEKDYKLANPPMSVELVKKIYENNWGLGPIDELFHRDDINEIWVNGAEHIWIEKRGKKHRLRDKKFKNDQDVKRVISLMLQFDKKDINTQNPRREARMLDGSRLTVVIPPVSKRPCINIRKFQAFDVTTDNYLKADTVNKEMVQFLQLCVQGRANQLIIGETGSGKTSFLKWLIDFMDPSLRLITIETNFELKIDEKYPERNIVSYEEHPELGVYMDDLFRTCLRSSPDIIICGEARGEEADELIRSMRRGHPGSLGTMHSNTPDTTIDDLAEMILEDGQQRDPIQLRYRVATALDIIVQMRLFGTGERRVAKITEVIPSKTDYTWTLNDIYRYEVDKMDPTKGDFVKVGKLSDSLKDKLNYYGVPFEKIGHL